MDVKREQQELREIKRWLAGDKPPAAGRRWQRMAEAVVPPVVRTACQETFGHEAGDVVACVVTGMIPLACAGLLLLLGEGLAPMAGESGSPLFPMAVLIQAMCGVLRSLAWVVLVLGVTWAGLRLIRGR
jgi:hypothetical protein